MEIYNLMYIISHNYKFIKIMGNFKLSIPVDNTYNVASDTHRQNIVSMKESTMNKEIKKRRKEDKDV